MFLLVAIYQHKKRFNFTHYYLLIVIYSFFFKFIFTNYTGCTNVGQQDITSKNYISHDAPTHPHQRSLSWWSGPKSTSPSTVS